MTNKVGPYQPLDPKKPHHFKTSKTQPNLKTRIQQYFLALEESNRQIDALIQSVSKNPGLNRKAKSSLKKLLRSNVEKNTTSSKVTKANAALSPFDFKATLFSKREGKPRILLTATGLNRKVLGEGGFKKVTQAAEISGRINLLSKDRLYKAQVHYDRAATHSTHFDEDVQLSVFWSNILHENTTPGATWQEDPSQLFLKYKEIQEGEQTTLTASPLGLVDEKVVQNLSKADRKLFIAQLITANAFLKQKGILHRDIKLDNLLLKTDKDGNKQLVIADFGLMEKYKTGRIGGSYVGTPGYMPPLAKGEYDGEYANRQDDFSFGLVILQIAANYDIELLHDSSKERIKTEDLPPISLENVNQIVDELRELTNPLGAIIAGLLAQPPEKRISMEEAKVLCDQIEDEHFDSLST